MRTIIIGLVSLFLFGCDSDSGQRAAPQLPQFRLFEVRFCSGEVDTLGAFSWEIEVIAGEDCPQLRFHTRIDLVTGLTLKSIAVYRVASVKEIYRER